MRATVNQFKGPNPFYSGAAVVFSIPSEELADGPKTHVNATLSRLAGFAGISCPLIDDALSFMQVVSDISVELLNYTRGALRPAKVHQQNGQVIAALGYHDAKVTEFVFSGVLKLCNIEGGATSESIRKFLDQVSNITLRAHPDWQAGLLTEACALKGVPVRRIMADQRYWLYGEGVTSQIRFETQSDQDGNLAAIFCTNKALAKDILRKFGLPTPEAQIIPFNDGRVNIKGVSFPCVVKPLSEGGARGVTANIRDHEQLKLAIPYAFKASKAKTILIEEHLEGEDYRLMVMNGRFFGAFIRMPPAVIGDGKKSLRLLIEEFNTARRGSLRKNNFLKMVPLDDYLKQFLTANGYKLDDVISEGETVLLAGAANRSRGGTCRDVSDKIDQNTRRALENFCRSISLQNAGFDYIGTEPPTVNTVGKGGFVEVNSTPGLAVPINAGWGPETIKEGVLGNVAALPNILVLTDNPAGAYNPDTIPEGYAFCCDDFFVPSGTGQRVSCASVHQAVDDVVIQKSTMGLQIAMTPDELYANGLPVMQVGKLVLNGVQIQDDWRSVLERSDLIAQNK